jgi:predicted metalloprotease with PDZ domain
VLLLSAGIIAVGALGGQIPTGPAIRYTLAIDGAHLEVADVTIDVRDVPHEFELAMKVHAEYDARYWRYLDTIRVETRSGGPGTVAPEGNTLWRVTLPADAAGGRAGSAWDAVIRYRVHIQAPPSTGLRRAWMPYSASDGALINPPDFFLYLPAYPHRPVTVELHVPDPWLAATSLQPVPARTLASHGGPICLDAQDALTLLDSPILVGVFRHWQFADHGTRYHVVYWATPHTVPFDTSGFVDRLHRLARVAADAFGPLSAPNYWFLIQDDASDALEHRASVTIGVPSARLAQDIRASTTEIAHEFIHAWNLVAIRPNGYNDLTYQTPSRTPSLWIGEGLTLYYAEALPRRAGIMDTTPSRAAHLAQLLERYDASPATMSVSPEVASLAFEDSPVTNPNATGGYYLQGELLGYALDALERDSTHDRHTLDDVLRTMYTRARAHWAAPGGEEGQGDGYAASDFEAVADSVCRCRLHAFFARDVRGAGPIDLTPALARLGWRVVVDSSVAVDDSGRPRPDMRVRLSFVDGVPLKLVLPDSTSPWIRAGVRTGDGLIAIDSLPITSFNDLQAAASRVRLDQDGTAPVTVDVVRDGVQRRLTVVVRSYRTPRVHFENALELTAAEQARRAEWLAGN